ncbi:MAG TPA: methionyl-tRNA formyltransferase [Clostridia bacterium]|nr:methionyl-tRNA formyltransferase [Clostridia bacterium]
MRLLFMGTPDFAVPSLAALELGGHEVLGVVTQPDRPKGRGKKLSPPPVKVVAKAYGLDVYQPSDIRDPGFIKMLKTMDLDVIVVVAYGEFLPRTILDIPREGCINVHASLLPEYRGAAPIHRAIINGERITGVTTMYLAEGMDNGDIIDKVSTEIKEEDNVGILHDRLAEAGARLLLQTLISIESGDMKRTAQDSSKATYAPPLTRKDGLIDWGRQADEIFNLVRGLDPWPGAFTYLNSKILKIWRVNKTEPDHLGDGESGSVLKSSDSELLVKTGKGIIGIEELQLQGLRRMKVSDFLRGRSVPPGTVLGKPIRKKE